MKKKLRTHAYDFTRTALDGTRTFCGQHTLTSTRFFSMQPNCKLCKRKLKAARVAAEKGGR